MLLISLIEREMLLISLIERERLNRPVLCHSKEKLGFYIYTSS
jgi:hypothetical protein